MQMRNELPVFQQAVRALVCTNCHSSAALKIEDDQMRCPDCSTDFPIIDGVLDLMPPDYSGYAGDSEEEAVLRDAHNRQTVREDSAQFRAALARIMPPKALVLDAGCGTGQLTKIICESHPDMTVIATDVSPAMCRLAAENCRGQPVLVIRTPSTKQPPMPFRDAVFNFVLNRLAPMNPAESFRLLRSGGYALAARWVDAHWQEISRVFAVDRLITFPRDPDPTEALFEVGFSKAELHAWRFTKTRSLPEIVAVLNYAPVVRDFDETADQPFLRKLVELYGDENGVCLTEGESLLIGRKEDE
jgi:SAM-dependent methyltransferase